MPTIMDNQTAVDLWQIIAHYGYAHQKHKAIEEFSELTEALSRDLNGDGDRANIAEEMADCYILLSQLMLIYGNRPDVLAAMAAKLDRTLKQVAAERTGEAGA